MYLLRAECGPRVLTAADGNITSPGFPGAFPSYSNCTWTIQAGELDTVTLSFQHFSMGYDHTGQECLQWYEGAALSIYDGNSADNETLIAT